MLKRPSRMDINAYWNHETNACGILVKGDTDGYYYYAPDMDEYIRQLTAKLHDATDRLNAMSDSRLSFGTPHD